MLDRFLGCFFGTAFLLGLVVWLKETKLFFPVVGLVSWVAFYYLVYDWQKYENGDYREQEIVDAKFWAVVKSFFIAVFTTGVLNGLNEKMRVSNEWFLGVFGVLFVVFWISASRDKQKEAENQESEQK